MNTNQLQKAWELLSEYDEFRSMAKLRRQLNEQLRNANISLTNVPGTLMVRAILSRRLFGDNELNEMNKNTDECLTEDDARASETTIDLLLTNDDDDESSGQLFEINELKQRFQRAFDIIPKSRNERKQMLRCVISCSLNEIDEDSHEDESIDLNQIFTDEEQQQMRTGDLIEFSGNRLHDAYYVYRLPQKGIWSQIKRMWSNHQTIEFNFSDNEIQDEIILVPAMDEYGYGVPYLFSTMPNENLPSNALYKYVDINCPLISQQTDNLTVELVQKHLAERLINPVYEDRHIGEQIQVDLSRFPQEYVAMIYIDASTKDNIVWVNRAHYNRRSIARDLNDNLFIFYSRRILEAQDQFNKRKTN